MAFWVLGRCRSGQEIIFEIGTPFRPLQAALVSLGITLAGFLSGLLFSAIKGQRGIKDWGTAIQGHGGVLDRVDSHCLAAPLFVYCVRSLVPTSP